MRRRRGITPVISTVILVSSMMAIVLVVINYAGNMLAIQSQEAEFEQAKGITISLAEGIEEVASKPGSTSYVRYNTRAGGPNFLYNTGTINVTIAGTQTGMVNALYGPLNEFSYKGGSLVSTTYSSIRGYNKKDPLASSPIILNNNDTLGRIYTQQKDGAYIVMDYNKISVLNIGPFNLKKVGAGYQIINYTQISFINITRGSTQGSDAINVVAKCIHTQFNYYDLPNGGVITVVVNGVQSPPLQLLGNSRVLVTRFDVELSSFGG